MSEEARLLLEAIVAGRLAWSLVSDLGERGAAVPELVALGLAALWPLSTGMAVTLTPRAAFILGVEIHETPLAGDPFWAPRGSIEPRPRMKRQVGIGRLAFPELVVDTAPGPLEVLVTEWGMPVVLWGRTIQRERRRRRRGRSVVQPADDDATATTGKPARASRTARKPRPRRKPATPDRVTVRALRPVLGHARGELFELRPSQAAAWVAAGLVALS